MTNGNTIELEVRPSVDDGDEDHWQVRFWVDLEFRADGSGTWVTLAEGDVAWRLLEGSKWEYDTTLNQHGSGTYRITGNADFFNFCTNVYEWDVGQGDVRTVTVDQPAVTVTGHSGLTDFTKTTGVILTFIAPTTAGHVPSSTRAMTSGWTQC